MWPELLFFPFDCLDVLGFQDMFVLSMSWNKTLNCMGRFHHVHMGFDNRDYRLCINSTKGSLIPL